MKVQREEIHRAVTQHSFTHSFIKNRQKRLIWTAVQRELTEERMFVSWTFFDTTELHKEMWVRWKFKEK